MLASASASKAPVLQTRAAMQVKINIFILKIKKGLLEMAQWLKAHTGLFVDLSSILST